MLVPVGVPVWLDELVPVLVWLDVLELVLVWLDELVPVLVGLAVRELVLVWLEELVPVFVWLGLGVQEGCKDEQGAGRGKQRCGGEGDLQKKNHERC